MFVFLYFICVNFGRRNCFRIPIGVDISLLLLDKKMIWFKKNTSISYIRLLFCNKTFWIHVKCWELFVRNASSINRTTGKRDIAVGCVIVFILQFKKKTFHFCFNLFNLRWDCRIDFIRFEYIWISCNNRSNRRSS